MIKTIQFNLNDKPLGIEVDDEQTLLWVLRTDLGLTGAKFGCGEGLCGACTVLVDDEAMPSCQISVGYVAGREVACNGVGPWQISDNCLNNATLPS